ncbi:MAG: N-acetylmuramoyl-L-alanine amidase [Gammaproteobacteria bacterium]|nr:N-acetylmuramoyl-L-alanine amidase [Gammaproteobacteria bacterium]
MIVAIDAGHGGEDPGAIGSRGTQEKEVVMEIASAASADKVNRRSGMRAVLTRDGDYFLPLRRRIEIAREHQADLFISLHADAFRDRRVHGSSVYVLSKRGASSEAARWLAEQENASDLIGGVSLEDKDDVLKSVLLDLSQTGTLEVSIDVAERLINGLSRTGKVHRRDVQSAGFLVLKAPDIPSVLVEAAFISNPDEERKLRDKVHQERLARCPAGMACRIILMYMHPKARCWQRATG